MKRDPFREIFCNFPSSENILFRTRGQLLKYRHFHQLLKTLEKKVPTTGLHSRELVAINTQRNLNPLEIFLSCAFLWRKGLTPVLIPPEIKEANKDKYLEQVPCAAGFDLFASPMEIFELPELKERPFTYTKKTNDFHPPGQGIVAFSSGSRGLPKGIHLTFANLYHSALGTTEFYHFRDEDEWALTLPPHHVGGFLIFVRALLTGASVALPKSKERWTSSLLTSTTFISVVSTQLKELLDKDDKEKLIESSLPYLKTIILGGGPCPKELLKRAQKKNWPLYLTYGQTEMAAQITSTSVNEYTQGHAGPPLKGREIRISPTGEILLKGDTRFYGHYQKQTLFRPFDKEGFFPTQDLGEWDKKGNLIVKGRADRVFISGGENVNPTLIENKLGKFIEKQNHLAIKDFRLFPLPSEKFGQVPGLYYRVLDNADMQRIFSFEESLNEWVQSELSPHERPRFLCFDPRLDASLKLQNAKAAPHIEKQWKLARENLSLKIWGDPKLPALVFIHGFMGSKYDARHVFAQLLQNQPNFFQTRCLVGIDLPAHGENTEKPPPFHEASKLLAKTLKSLAEESNELSIWGYSMGGRLLMNALLQDGELAQKVENLFIQSASPGLESCDEREKRLNYDKALFERLDPQIDPQEFFKNWYGQPLFGDLWQKESAREFLLSRHSKETWEKERERYQNALLHLSVARQPSLWEEIDNLPTPCFWIYGKEDGKYAKLLKRACAAHSGHSLRELSGGHACHLESPEQLAELLAKRSSS